MTRLCNMDIVKKSWKREKKTQIIRVFNLKVFFIYFDVWSYFGVVCESDTLFKNICIDILQYVYCNILYRNIAEWKKVLIMFE